MSALGYATGGSRNFFVVLERYEGQRDNMLSPKTNKYSSPIHWAMETVGYLPEDVSTKRFIEEHRKRKPSFDLGYSE